VTAPRERGFALVAALFATLAFAAIAFQLYARGKGTVEVAQAELDRARMEAAADAGLALTIDHLTRAPEAGRWSIDGRPRTEVFDGTQLRITIEDERGKIPLNLITRSEVRRMFEAAGVPQKDVPPLLDAFLDWRDDDDRPRRFGAETEVYAPLGYRPRNGALRTVEELIRIRGVTPEIYARLAPAVTVHFGESGGFSERNAHPIALAVMAATRADSPAVIQRRRELAGQRTAFETAAREDYRARALTVRVEATGARGERVMRATVIELTGNAREPVWVRARL